MELSHIETQIKSAIIKTCYEAKVKVSSNLEPHVTVLVLGMGYSSIVDAI